MAWAGLASNQMVSFTDAQGGGFTLKSGQSSITSNQCMTKNDAFTKYNLATTANTNTVASNQLMRKDYWVAATILPYTYTLYYASGDTNSGIFGFTTSAAACSATSPSVTVYSSSSTIVSNMALYYDQYGNVPAWSSSYTTATPYFKLNSSLIRFQVNDLEIPVGYGVYDVSSCAVDPCFSLVEVARGGSSSIACNNANSGIYIAVSADTDTLLGATKLYRRCSDKLPALSGWYAEGPRARQWNGSAFVGSPIRCII